MRRGWKDGLKTQEQMEVIEEAAIKVRENVCEEGAKKEGKKTEKGNKEGRKW